MSKKLRVNKEACIACGLCYASYPDVFKSDDEGKADVIEGAPIDESKVQEMIDVCSVEAIEAYDE